MVSDARHPLLEGHIPLIEASLRSTMAKASESGLPLYRMMQYELGWLDKDGNESPNRGDVKAPSCICAEAAKSLAAEKAAYDASVAVELFARSVEVHEQMQSGEAGPPDHPAVWWVWGPAQAINVGDGLHALARLAAMRLKDGGLPIETTLACVDVLDDLALRYYEGQYVELTYQERVDITTAQYSAAVRSKHGALIGGACALGASVAGADASVVHAFNDLGISIGEAAQVQADLSSLFGRASSTEGRLLNKSKLYPVVEVLDRGTLAEKRAVGTIYFKRVMEASDVAELRRVLEESGARERSEIHAAELTARAKEMVETVPLASDASSRWLRIVDEVVGTS